MQKEIHGGRQLSHNVLESYRFRAVDLWKQGEKITKIAYFFGLNRVTVADWIGEYRKHGKKVLYSKKAKGPEPKLTQKEIMRIFHCIRKPATEFGFDTPLWTCRRLHQLIKQQTRKELHASNVWRWLIKCGFTSQKPERAALEADPKEQKMWIEKEWPEILEKARQWRAIIYFQDEAGVSLTAVLGKTWAKKGKTPVVSTTGKKGNFCVSSAISPSGRMVFRIEKETVNAKVFISFIKQVMEHHPKRKIIMIIDKAPPHIAKSVDDFAEQNKNRLAVYRLPSYSPKLNPDEQVWKHLKHNKLKAHQIKSKKEFKPFLVSKMKSIQMSHHTVKSFFIGTYVV